MRVLVYEPDDGFVSELKRFVGPLASSMVFAENEENTGHWISKHHFNLLVWPVDTPKQMELLKEWRNSNPQLTIISTSYNCDPQHIVSCMQWGASQFFQRSRTVNELAQLIINFLPQQEPSKNSGVEAGLKFPQIIGRHPSLLQAFKMIERVSLTDSSVLITGPSGTGKELIAHAIHQTGNRKSLPWVPINCAAIPDNLLESELFGHVKGAFTGAVQNRAGRFQLAGKGTLFLDEIGELNFDLQAKLLRALQTKLFEPVGSAQSIKLEARIIAATNQNLERLVSEKKFREDLYYRLNVIPIDVPALKNRPTDIPLLANYFIRKFSSEHQMENPGITHQAMRCLMQYHWPGNIRELENLLERVLVLKEQPGPIDLSDFPEGYFKNVRLDRFLSNVAVPDEGLDFNLAVNEFENELILQALQKTSGNKNKAATLLKLNRTTLVEKLKRKGLQIIS